MNHSKWATALRVLSDGTDSRLYTLAALALFAVVASAALAVFSPVLLKLLVDNLAAPSDGPYLNTGVLIAAYAGSHWTARVIAELRSGFIGRMDQRLQRRLTVLLFTRVMSLPLRFHLDRRTGALSQTLTDGLFGYRLLVQHFILSIFPVVLEIAMIGGVLLALQQPIFVVILATSLIAYGIVFSIGAMKLTTPARNASTAQVDAAGILTDSIINYETIKMFCAESDVHQRINSALEQTEVQWKRFYTRKVLSGVLAAGVLGVALGISLYIAAGRVQQGEMSLGDLVLVSTYMLQTFRPIETLGFAARDVAQGAAFIDKMVEVFREPQEPAYLSKLEPWSVGPGELVFDSVCFSYGKEQVLQKISFRVAAGSTVAVVGESGSGKSSLIRLLIRFCEPDSGEILIDNSPIANVSARTIRTAIAVVPQDIVLFNDTIAYNVAMGRTDGSSREVTRAAQLASIHDFIVARPDGYETRVGERGLKLSGGEKQRIAIARAIVMKPRILVFDEATSCLDSKTEQKILRNLREVCRNTTTLIIAHRLSTIVTADQILVLEQGKIVERGSHYELLEEKGVYAGMWAAQHGDLNADVNGPGSSASA